MFRLLPDDVTKKGKVITDKIEMF